MRHADRVQPYSPSTHDFCDAAHAPQPRLDGHLLFSKASQSRVEQHVQGTHSTQGQQA